MVFVVCLIFSTVPKAWLFKSAVSTFLRPVYAVMYALCGIVLSLLITIFTPIALILRARRNMGVPARMVVTSYVSR